MSLISLHNGYWFLFIGYCPTVIVYWFLPCKPASWSDCLLVIVYWLLFIGYWLLFIVYWLLFIGYWLLSGSLGFLSGSDNDAARSPSDNSSVAGR